MSTQYKGSLLELIEKAFRNGDHAVALDLVQKKTGYESVRKLELPIFGKYRFQEVFVHGDKLETVEVKGCMHLLEAAAAYGWVDVCKTLVSKSYARSSLFQSRVTIKPSQFECGGKIVGRGMRRSPFYYAAGGGHLDVIKFLVRNYQCTDDGEGPTPLSLAVIHGHLETVKYLVSECNQDPNRQTKEIGGSCEIFNNLTPFLFACLLGHSHIIRYLVSIDACDPREPLHFDGKSKAVKTCCTNVVACMYSEGSTVLHLVARVGHLEIVKYLIEECGLDPNAANRDSLTAMHMAWDGRHLSVVSYLMFDCGLTWNLSRLLLSLEPFPCDMVDADGNTLLHEAARRGRLDGVQFLIKQGNINPNAKNRHLQTALQIAVDSQHLPVVKYLVFNCAKELELDPLILHIASSHINNLELMKYLVDPTSSHTSVETKCLCAAYTCNSIPILKSLSNNPRLNLGMPVDGDGNTLLHLSASSNQLQMVKFLITKCLVDPGVRNRHSQTALHMAVEGSHVSMVRYLVLECAKQLQLDPLVLRIVREHVEDLELLKLLIASNSDEGRYGMSAEAKCLNAAFALGRMDVIESLVQEFPTLSVDSKGNTILHLAARSGNLDVVKFLVEKCAFDINAQINTHKIHSTALVLTITK